MKLDYITTYDVLDRSSWPKEHLGLYGAGYHLAQQLQQDNIDLNFCSPLHKYKTPVTRLKWLFYRKFFHQKYYSWAEPILGKYYAKQIMQKLSKSSAEIAFCPENAIPIAQVKCSKPLILWIDAPISCLIGFYSYLDDLCRETEKNLYCLEQAAFEQCDRLVCTSDWAANLATKTYRLSPEKVSVIPRSGNISTQRDYDEVIKLIEYREKETCNLLFVGVDWVRKGGEFAVEVTQNLNEAGVKATLNVVGCQPPLSIANRDFVNVIGYINKSTTSGQQQLDHLFATSHFLILPSKAETNGLVFIEANSYGVPCIASNIGGIPAIIHDGKNGKTFPLETNSLVCSQYIAEVFANQDYYQSLAMSAFNEYQSRLNWQATSQAFQTLFHDVLNL